MNLFAAIIACIVTASFSAQAAPSEVKSSQVTVAPSRVVHVETLVAGDDKVRISFVVVDNGGATDVSPTQSLIFTLYQKGEMFNIDANFDLGPIVAFKSAKRAGAGIYEATVRQLTKNADKEFDETIRIDAGKALVALKAVRCGDEYPCKDAENFKTAVSAVRK